MVLTPSQQNRNRLVRRFILAEVLAGYLEEYAYKEFCQIFGEVVISYREFDYWFYRFHETRDLQCELDYENDLRSNHRELLDLPVELLVKITGNLDSLEKLKIQEVCHDFKTIGKGLPIDLKFACLLCDDNEIHFSYNNQTIRCTAVNGGCELVKNGYTRNEKCEFIRNGNFLRIGASLVKMLMENSKLTIEKLLINQVCKNQEVWSKFITILEDSWKPLNNRIYAKTFQIICHDPKCLLVLLPFLNHGYCTKLELFNALNFHNRRPVAVFLNMELWDEIRNFEQWKQLESLKVRGFALPTIVIENYSHLTNIDLQVDSLSVEDVMRIKDAPLKLPKLERFCLTANQNVPMVHIGVMTQTGPYYMTYQPTGSSETFRASIKFLTFSIWRNRDDDV